MQNEGTVRVAASGDHPTLFHLFPYPSDQSQPSPLVVSFVPSSGFLTFQLLSS